MVMVSTIITTLLSFVKPTVNAYALNFFALHILYSVCVELKRYAAALTSSSHFNLIWSNNKQIFFMCCYDLKAVEVAYCC